MVLAVVQGTGNDAAADASQSNIPRRLPSFSLFRTLLLANLSTLMPHGRARQHKPRPLKHNAHATPPSLHAPAASEQEGASGVGTPLCGLCGPCVRARCSGFSPPPCSPPRHAACREHTPAIKLNIIPANPCRARAL